MSVVEQKARPGKTALEAGYAMPAEWAPHERCWMAWPCSSHWDEGPGLEAIRGVFADVLCQILKNGTEDRPCGLPNSPNG